MESTFGWKAVNILIFLQGQIVLRQMKEQQADKLQKLYDALRFSMAVYLNNRNSIAGKYLMACVENDDAIRLQNEDVIDKLIALNVPKNK